jgi:hypothetical protein
MMALGIVGSGYKDPTSYTNLYPEGKCDSTSSWTAHNGTLEVDSADALSGNCIKTIIANTKTYSQPYDYVTTLVDSSKYYLFSGYVKNGNLTSIGIRVYFSGSDLTISAATSASTSYVRQGVIIQPADFVGGITVQFQVRSAYHTSDGSRYGFFDSLMINEITAEDYAAGVDACLAKYPYIDP